MPAKTMRICILGNSHVACLRQAWPELAAGYPGSEIRFFASRGARIGSLQLSDGVLSTSDADVASDLRNTSGGQDAIKLSDFDVFLVHGLLPMPRLPTHLSNAVVRQCIEDAVDAAINTQLARLIRGATKLPVYSGHVPLRALEQSRQPAVDYARVHEGMRERMARDGILLLRQPDETIGENFSTRPEFAKGAPRLAADNVEQHSLQYPEDNIAHMNVAYGRLFLAKFLSVLAAPEAGVP